MKKTILTLAALAAFAAFGVTPNTEWQNVPGTDKVGEVLSSGGAVVMEQDPVWNAQKGGYQPKLVSGTNIKTVNGNSLLGNGNIEIVNGNTNSVDGAARPLPAYLHALDFADSYPEDAAWYYANAGGDYAACSARRVGNLVERNYDWKFDDAAEFVVRMAAGPGRFASVGVANVGTNLAEAAVTSGRWSRYYKALPGHTVDGINENGVVAEVNVVGGEPPASTGGDIHPLGAVRWALDHATGAGMAASNLAERVAFPSGWSQNFHWMLADGSETWIVENGAAHQVTNAPAVMTNFSLDRIGGEGYERWTNLVNGASITSQWWTAAYTPEGYRASDLQGIDTNLLFRAWAEKPREAHRGETFGGKSWWQTVHTSVYDITNRTLRVAVQETGDWYAFAVPAAGGGVTAETDPVAMPRVTALEAEVAAIPRITESENYDGWAANADGAWDAVNATYAVMAERLGNYKEDDLNEMENAISSHSSQLSQQSQSIAENAEAIAENAAAIAAAALAATNYTDSCCSALAVLSTNYTDAATNAISLPRPGYSWSSPGEWAIDWTPSEVRSVVTGEVSRVDDSLRVWARETVASVLAPAATCRAVALDPTSIEPPSVESWATTTPGSSITPDGFLTADAPGLCRVAATATNGVTRYGYVPLNAASTVVSSNVEEYVCDAAGSVRQAVNAEALAVLADALERPVSTNSYGGTTYVVYDTFRPRLAPVGSGQFAAFAVSPHVLASAWHYPWLGLGDETFDDGEGRSATVRKLRWVRLSTWAATNGWSEAELAAMTDVGDIALCVCDPATAVPDGCLPTFMAPATRRAWFGASMSGVQTWEFSQQHAHAIPLTMHDDRVWSSSTTWSRRDVAAVLDAMGPRYPIHVGDSGRPIILRRNGEEIVLSACHTGGSGPDYTAAFPLIKQFVESVGDTLKEAN